MEGDDGSPPLSVPERVFVSGEEPMGVRVTPYNKPSAIRKILSALDPEEIQIIRSSSFGKLVDIAEKPSFSGRFGRFIISRQLKTCKKHEAWFLFAGKPVRFSLREFAYVTGLNCGKFPKSTKKRTKRDISEKPYWGEMFGTLKEISVSSVVRMLKKRTVTERGMRVKYACLGLLAAVILPTTHNPRISEDHAELIKDLDEFFAYPWGRVSFDLLISSIKQRNEVSLSQNTIALKGFVLALQLVMVEAIPALTEVVNDGSSSGSEGEGGEDDDLLGEDRSGKRSISPGYARDTDAKGKAEVHSIIVDEYDHFKSAPELGWSDEEDDPTVDNLVSLVEQRYPFNKTCFTGGVSMADVNRMREEAKTQADNRKSTKHKQVSRAAPTVGADPELVASIVQGKIREDITRMERQIGSISETFVTFQTVILDKIQQLADKLESVRSQTPQPNVSRPHLSNTGTQTQTVQDESGDHIINDAIRFANHATTDPDQGPFVAEGIHTAVRNEDITSTGDQGKMPREDAHLSSRHPTEAQESSVCDQTRSISKTSLDPAMLFPNPTFSLGLTQEERLIQKEIPTHPEKTQAEEDGEETRPQDDTIVACRKSKRQKALPRALLGQYQCDQRLLNRVRVAHVDSNITCRNIDYSAKFAVLLDKLKSPFDIPLGLFTLQSSVIVDIIQRSSPLPTKVVDVLMGHVRSHFILNSPVNPSTHSACMDTNFVSQFSKLFPKFSKTSKKDGFRFPSTVIDMLQMHADADRFYFPFNLDKTHWVGMCVDFTKWAVVVIDCNTSLRSDSMMQKEVRPISLMLPYLMKQAGKKLMHKDARALAIERPRTIPQNTCPYDSAVTSVLLIQAHAVAGVDVCKCITPEVLDSEIERLVVTFYESTVGAL